MIALAAVALILASGSAAANPSANLDQCANDPAPSASTDGCNSSATQWVNGNLGASKSVYFEGDSIPYRMVLDNLSFGASSPTHTLTIEWDTTKSGKHAIDYLTTFNRTVGNADPCLGVSGCGSPTTFPIPVDPNAVNQVAGNLTIYGGSISSINPGYSVSGSYAGDSSTRFTINFHANVANPVIAWGGHIATRADWGANNSAVAISGSPYHMRLIELDGSGGNQDRSLSADAVIFPGSITIIKDAVPNDPTSFSYTASPSPLSNFSLVDNGGATNTKVFSNITNFQTYTVTEGAASGWTLSFPNPCTVTSPNGGSQTTSVANRNVVIGLAEGENVTCTFVNTRQKNSPSIATTLSATSITVGGSASDSSSLTGATANAGGTVTYTVYSDNACSQNARDAGTKAVTAGVPAGSNSLTFSSAGTFYWQAVYSGDANNNGATSPCTSEILTVGKASPSIATTLSATSITVGGSASDSSSLTGATSDAGGTVTYTVYSDSACTQNARDAGTKAVTAGVPAGSNSLTFSSAGTFYWQAVYSGDANNSGATSTCTDEQLVVNNPPVLDQITPTQTTCQQFSSNTAATLSQLQYSLKGNPPIINQVSPGVLFYWIKVTAVAGSNTFHIVQSDTSSVTPPFGLASGSNAYKSDCSTASGVSITQSGSTTTVTFTAASGGTFYIGIKYDPGTVKNSPAPSPSTVHYTFTTSEVAGSGKGLDLVKK